jgi:hypothetical protein
VDIDELGGSQKDEVKLAKARELLNQYVEEFEAWFRFRQLLPLVDEVKSFAGAELIRALPEIDPEKATQAGNRVMDKLLFPLKDTLSLDELEDCYRALAEVAQKVGGTR